MTALRTLFAAVALACIATPAAAQTYLGPTVLLVNPRSSVKTVPEFIAWSARAAQPLRYGTEGANSGGHMFAQKLAGRLGFQAVHVPYRGSTQAIVDLIAGFIDFAALPVYATAGQIRGGLLVPVALAAKARLPEFPDLPTFTEAGYPEFVSRSFQTGTLAASEYRLNLWQDGFRIAAPRRPQ